MRTIQKNIEMGGVKFTQAGNARSEFIKGIGKKNYDINFPFLQQIEETNIRKHIAVDMYIAILNIKIE